MYAHLDGDREITKDVQVLLKECYLSSVDQSSVVVLSGPAGSGKTTFAKRAAISSVEGFSVYFAEHEGRPVPERIMECVRRLNRRIILVSDEATSDLRLICDLVAKCEGLKSKPVFFLTARTTDLAVKKYLLQGLTDLQEIKVPDLSDRDIHEILQTLEDHDLLGYLRGLAPNERVQLFRDKAKKQILIAMREATRGKGFDEIIQDEFNQVQPSTAQLLESWDAPFLPKSQAHPLSRPAVLR